MNSILYIEQRITILNLPVKWFISFSTLPFFKVILTTMTTTKTTVPALDRTIAILDIISDSQQALTAAEIVRLSQIPRSTGHGLLAAMVEHGLIHKSSEQRYSLGSQVMHWANNFLSQQDIVTAFQNEIITATELSRFSLTLSIRQGREVICLACRNGDETLGFTFSIGLRLPAAFAATGKAMLSTLTDTKVKKIYENSWHEPMTASSLTNSETLVDELQQIRHRGYSVDDGQIREGMLCIGVPVFDHSNTAHNGIALSMSQSEADPQTIELLGKQLRHLGNSLSRKLGATIV